MQVMLQLLSMLFVFLLVVLFFLLNKKKSCQALKRFQERACTGRSWRKRFPVADKDDIRGFLRVFSRGFGFPKGWVLKFEPGDEIMEIYQGRNPEPGWPDSGEFEVLTESLQEEYGFSLGNHWKEGMTLADLFQVTCEKKCPSGKKLHG